MSARRWWAWPLVPVYAAVVALKDALRGEPKKLRWPVVSVGSLSAGGAGKTPVVIALVELLQRHGRGVDVLSRGHGREGVGVERVVAGNAKRFGDEPTLIAERTEVDVWVGTERYEAGLSAETAARAPGSRPGAPVMSAARSIHVLDDGFQHRQLFRNVDVVLVTAEDLDDALLPAGNRREKLTALGRASAVVIRERERAGIAKKLKQWTDAPVWVIRRRLKFESPLAMLGAGLRPMAFCAIARPQEFQEMVLAAGCGIVDTMAYRDHHAYTEEDIARLCQVARKLKVTGFVTTEKDAVKLTDAMRAMLSEVGPLLVARLEVEFEDEDAAMSLLAERLQ